MLIIIFGLNGVGKDALVEKVASTEDIIVSSSRMLMFELGLISSFTARPNQEDYLTLEQIPWEQKERLLRFRCGQSLKEIKAHNVFFLAHLVVCMYLDGKEHYRNYPFSPWLLGASGFARVTATPGEILARREGDKRKRPLSFRQIKDNEEKSERRWENLISRVGIKRAIEIHNKQGRLLEASANLQRFLTSLEQK